MLTVQVFFSRLSLRSLVLLFLPFNLKAKGVSFGESRRLEQTCNDYLTEYSPTCCHFHCRTSKAEFGFYSFCCQRGVCGGSTVIVPSAADLFDSPAVGKPGSDWSSRTSYCLRFQAFSEENDTDLISSDT